MIDADVVVVGAGPSGAVTSLLLARQGVRVVLLDRAHFPRPKPCGEYLSPGVADELRALELPDILEDTAARAICGMDILSPRGKRLPMRYDVDGRQLPAWTVPRLRLDAALVQRAVAAGVRFEPGVVVRDPIIEDGTVRGVIGREVRSRSMLGVRAPLTVVADGGRSHLARRLGLAVEPRWPVRIALVAHYAGAWPDVGEMHVAGDGYCGVAPLPEDGLNVGMVVRMDAVRRSGLDAQRFFERRIEASPGLAAALKEAHQVTRVRGVAPIGARCSVPWCKGALLVGDAAGFFDPFTGEGVYRALQGASFAAESCAAYLAGGGIPALQRYGRRRTQQFRAKSAVTALVQCFVQYPALMEYALPRLEARPDAYHALATTLGDVAHPRTFLNPAMLFQALRP